MLELSGDIFSLRLYRRKLATGLSNDLIPHNFGLPGHMKVCIRNSDLRSSLSYLQSSSATVTVV